MKRTSWILTLLLSICACAAGQDKQNPLCPMISIDSFAGVVAPGQIAHYEIKLGATAKNYPLEFVWKVTSGKIVEGQGTKKIGVVGVGLSQVVTVDLKGLPPECPSTASDSYVIDPPLPSIILDQFPFSFSSTLDDRLKEIAEALDNSPTSQLYMFVPPDAAVRGALLERLQKVNPAHKVDPQRMTFVQNASRNSKIQIWLVPPGATPPSKCEGCEPTEAPAPPSCPTLEVSGPTGTTLPGVIMPFVVLVSEPRLKNLTFSWTASAGTIVEGQTTRVVKIKAPTQKAKVDVTATVRIGGLPQGCQNTATATRPVGGL